MSVHLLVCFSVSVTVSWVNAVYCSRGFCYMKVHLDSPGYSHMPGSYNYCF